MSKTLYRVVQEALTNIFKYAEATKNQIQLVTTGDFLPDSKGDRVCLTIEDNGKGFSCDQKTTGFGLQGMQERVAALEGAFHLRAKPGAGCQIKVELPLPGAAMIRLLLVEDQSLMRQGLQAVFTQEPDLQVVGSAENGQVALDLVATLQPDVVLMDIQMPVMTGIEATRLISEKFPNTKVLVLSTFDEDRNIAQSMRAGAKGYLLKDMPAPELAEVIRLWHRGYSKMAPGLMEKLLRSVPSSDDVQAQPVSEELTQLPPRERDVLRMPDWSRRNQP